MVQIFNNFFCTLTVFLYLCTEYSGGRNVKKPINQKDKKQAPKEKETSSKRLYQKYLKTKWFENVRQKVLERDKYTCRTCGATSAERILNVHHVQYEGVLGDELNNLDKLITLCTVCHRAIHSSPANYRRFSSAGIDFAKIFNKDDRRVEKI